MRTYDQVLEADAYEQTTYGKNIIEQTMAQQFGNQSVRIGRYITQPSGY